MFILVLFDSFIFHCVVFNSTTVNKQHVSEIRKKPPTRFKFTWHIRRILSNIK